MPQNNQDIVNSQEFKDFCKNANLEVFNQEAINVALYNFSILAKDSFERANKIEEENKRLIDLIDGNVKISNYNQKMHDEQIQAINEKVLGTRSGIEYIPAEEFNTRKSMRS